MQDNCIRTHHFWSVEDTEMIWKIGTLLISIFNTENYNNYLRDKISNQAVLLWRLTNSWNKLLAVAWQWLETLWIIILNKREGLPRASGSIFFMVWSLTDSWVIFCLTRPRHCIKKKLCYHCRIKWLKFFFPVFFVIIVHYTTIRLVTTGHLSLKVLLEVLHFWIVVPCKKMGQHILTTDIEQKIKPKWGLTRVILYQWLFSFINKLGHFSEKANSIFGSTLQISNLYYYLRVSKILLNL